MIYMAEDSLTCLKRKLVLVGKRLFYLGMVSGTSGNISARVPDTETALITRTGVCLGDLRTRDLLLVDWTGKVLAGEGRPSKETRFHVGIYKARPDVGGIIHHHGPYATVFSIIAEELPLLTVAGRIYLHRVPRIPYMTPGSAELAAAVVEAFRDTSLKAVLMEQHGVTIVGSDIKDAFNLSGVLEDAAEVAYMIKWLANRQ